MSCPGPAVRQHDHPCPCACSISYSSASAAGWSCPAGHRPPRTPSCSCCGTRPPSCAAPIRGRGWTGPTGQSSPRSSGSCRHNCEHTGTSHPRHRPALAPPPGHPQVDLSAPDRTPAGQRRDRDTHRAARHREQRLGIPADPRRAPQARPPGQRTDDPPGPQSPEDPPGTATAHWHDLAEVPADPGIDDARHGLLPRGLRSDPAAPVLPVRHGGPAPVTCTSPVSHRTRTGRGPPSRSATC